MDILILWLIMYNQTMIIVPYLLMGPGLFTGAIHVRCFNSNI